MAVTVEEKIESGANNNGNSDSDLIKKLMARIDDLESKKESSTNNVSSDQTGVIRELVAQLKEKPDSEKFKRNSYVSISDIDPEDLLTEGVSFYCHKTMYVICDDVRSGHEISTPFNNIIVFGYQSTRKVGSGREAKLHNLSVYTSYSKKEVAWLESHSRYNSIFFSSHAKAYNNDSRKAEKIARIMTALSSYGVVKIVKMASDHGLAPSQDPNALRVALANKQAEDEMKREDSNNLVRLDESIKEKHLQESGNLPVKRIQD